MSPEQLPQDILQRVFATLEIPDLVRAGSVCSSWRAAYTSLLCSSSSIGLQQTPCLLYAAASAEAESEPAVGLYSLVEKKAYTLPALPDPPIRRRHIIGSSYGWIVTADERSQLHLVNPITGEQSALPSVFTIEQVNPVLDDAGSCEYSWYTGDVVISNEPSRFDLIELREYLFRKVFLSSDPSMGDDYVAVLIHNPDSQLSFARAGDDRWTWLPPHCDYEDCLFKGNLLYASTSLGEIHVFDLGSPSVIQRISSLGIGRMKDYHSERIYLAQAPSSSSCGSELLQVWRSEDVPHGGNAEFDSELEEIEEPDGSSFYMICTSEIKVHSVVLEEPPPSPGKLVEISGLGENALFLGHNQSLCLRAQEHPQLKANHVYFTDDHYLYTMGDGNNRRRDIGVFDLENNRSEEIVASPGQQLWSNWPAPVWLTPNPRRRRR